MGCTPGSSHGRRWSRSTTAHRRQRQTSPDQAWLTAGTRPTAAATLAVAVAARAYALNHPSEQARTALTAADAPMNRLPESERSDTWLTYGEQKHHVHLSHAFTTLGDTRPARESQQRAPELSAPTSMMTRALRVPSVLSAPRRRLSRIMRRPRMPYLRAMRVR